MTTTPTEDAELAFTQELDERLKRLQNRLSGYDNNYKPFHIFTPSTSMHDTAFLRDWSSGAKGTLTVLDPTTKTTTNLHSLNLHRIAETAPLLAYSFEETRHGPKYSIEDTSLVAVIAMLRYIYTLQHYVPDACFDEQMSMFLHVEIFRLAVVYDIPKLKDMVKARMFLELELSTSYPGPPKDLCKALAYAYEHLPNEKDLTKTLTHYCITCFLQHRLNEDELFKTFHYECRQFQRDLCLVLRENRFEDDTAPTLIRLPMKTFDKPMRWGPAVHDADPLSVMLNDEFEDMNRRRNADISRLDKLRIHFRVTLPHR